MDRQKKLLIFAAAWISAGLLTWFLYAKTVTPQQEKQAAVVVATHDMPPGTLLRASDLKRVNYPERSIPKGVMSDPKDAVNRVLLVPISNNEPVLTAKLSAATTVEGMASTIEPGFRAVSVQITDATGVAGMVQPNSHVDVLFTRPGSMAEAVTTTILEDVKVLSTGRQLATGQTADPRAPRSPVVTLVLTPADAQKLELAKNQGKISLSLRNPLDKTKAADAGPITTESLDPNVNARMALAKKGRVGGKKLLEDPKVWEDLANPPGAKKKAEEPKKEPEKPRVVVDVYRGDKHVQELFK
jgi:pilus assembly protein CpaB